MSKTHLIVGNYRQLARRFGRYSFLETKWLGKFWFYISNYVKNMVMSNDLV